MYNKSAIVSFISVLLLTTANAARAAEESKEAAELELTVEQYRLVLDGRVYSLAVVSTGDRQFSAIKVDIDDLTAPTVSRCSELFKKFLEEKLPGIQTLANRNCRVYLIIWRCPYGGYRFFVIKPFRLCGWKELIFKPKIPVWEWPQLEIELVKINLKL